MREEDNCRELIDRALADLGGIDIKTNVYAMFWLCRMAVPHLPEGSTIINTTSIQAFNPSPQPLDYATTKAAIANLTKHSRGTWPTRASGSTPWRPVPSGRR